MPDEPTASPIPPADTREQPGPFDAYSTLKPGEPYFLLQGGDDLAWKLAMMWARITRARALRRPENSDERREGLLKARFAEEAGWAMRAYCRGEALDTEVRSQAEASALAGKYRLDIYDARRQLALGCSKADSELLDLVRKYEEFETASEPPYGQALGYVQAARDYLTIAGRTLTGTANKST